MYVAPLYFHAAETIAILESLEDGEWEEREILQKSFLTNVHESMRLDWLKNSVPLAVQSDVRPTEMSEKPYTFTHFLGR